MRIINISIFAVCLLLSACSSREPRVEAIQQLEQKLRRQKDAGLDTLSANALIEKSLAFAAAYPKDSLSPAFLFQAADVLRGIQKPEEAVRLWGRVHAEYPGYERAADALFLQGFTCENNLSDKARALAYYQAFLDKYPKHPLVGDVSLSMEYLRSGKDLEELIKSFPKKPAQ
ncbi:MAG: tetratricopeptide repeat protein [Saprospiraceae bacterium]|nr:tetratricopeptide repeat protein [Saprospiraceae bacterium]MDZ4706508.1 tetratricopeptide repeat protein [Saprospiraceae bacterium]